MQIVRRLRLCLGIILIFSFLFSISPFQTRAEGGTTASPLPAGQQQRLIENIDIQGNRRLRDEDLLYYVQSRAGDPLNQTQLERDLQGLLALNFFDKTETRVLTEEGTRGGVNVIFVVKELPIIRALQFKGLKAVSESDLLKAFRENKVGISKEAVYDPVKTRNATRIIRELLSAKGYPNAKVDVTDEEVSATSTSITFNIDQGARSRLVAIDFDGNQVFKAGELRSQLKLTKETGLITRFSGRDILDRNKLEYDIRKNLLPYMQSKGYLNARFGEPVVEGLGNRRTGFFLPLPFLSSKDDTLKVTIPVAEGKLYRVGEVKITGNSIFSEPQIQSVIGLQKGEVANGKILRESLNESGLKKLYGSQGFIQYSAEVEPSFKDSPTNQSEGIADFNITIEEGKQFTLRRLEFAGNTFTRDNVLRREFLLNEGDIYNEQAFEYSVLRLNQTGYFDPIDKDKDKEIRTDDENGLVDTIVRVKERGRQQISFNGGVGGIAGSFFGLEYSTNNLLGRGEVLSFQAGLGNRQTSFQFSFTEPYFRDRPISVGFSLFATRAQFFGEGTFLSNNQNAQVGASIGNGIFNTDQSNLFTQRTIGASLFASAPLSEFYRKRQFTQFSRVGLSYQVSSTTLQDPKVNQTDPTNAIPNIFVQPKILTSSIIPQFVYDSRNYSGSGIDPSSGKQITFSAAIAGLGGDIRTYQPTVQYIQYTPVRRLRSKNPEVFGFRILAGTTGSFATTNKVRNNTLSSISGFPSFVGGVPFFSRYFLGDEFTVRGYNVRSIGPYAPIDTFVSARNVNIQVTDSAGALDPNQNLSSNLRQSIIAATTFTGANGANPSPLVRRYAQLIGGDTQLLGNFEYRIPIFGPLTVAAFADIGSVFNLRKGNTDIINSNFLGDQPFLGIYGTDLNTLYGRSTAGAPFGIANIFGRRTLILERDINDPNADRLLRADEYDKLPTSRLDSNGVPTATDTKVYRQIFLRGEAQTNTVVRVNDSLFNKFSDIRTSLGVEFRVQIPIVNAPFRLIYAFNPNARRGIYDNLVAFDERRSVFRFSVGRTF